MLLLLSVVAMLSIIPLVTFFVTGRWDRAWVAIREYLTVMALIVVPVLVVVAVMTLIP